MRSAVKFTPQLQLTRHIAGLFPVFGPAKFDCAIRARSVERAQLIAEQADIDRPKDLEDSSIYHQDLRKFMS